MKRHVHNRLADSVIVITGASTGIGRATALELARAADVTDGDAVKAAAREAFDAFGRIDAWINNAAVTLFGTLEECPPEAVFVRYYDEVVRAIKRGIRFRAP